MQIIINSLITGSIYALVAIGFSLIYSSTKFFNLAHGTYLAIGGYSFFWLTSYVGLAPLLSSVIAIVFTGCVGWLSEKLLFGKLREKSTSELGLMVASIGLMIVLQSIISIIFGNRSRILGLEYDLPVYHLFSLNVTAPQVCIFLSVLLITAYLSYFLKHTTTGKQIRAVGDDMNLARTIGIDSGRVTAIVFFLGALIAGLAGILIGLDSGIEPQMGFSWLIKGVIAAIIGTIGYWRGGILGAFLLAFLEQLVVWQFSGEWKSVVSFLVLIIFLVIRPQGVFQKHV